MSFMRFETASKNNKKNLMRVGKKLGKGYLAERGRETILRQS